MTARTTGAGAFPRRPVVRTILVGAVVALVATGVVRAAERLLLGTSSSVPDHVQDEVRQAFDAMARALRSMAIPLDDAERLRRAVDHDDDAIADLFERADASRRAAAAALPGKLPTGDLALTVYSARGEPLAWSGRPSELPAQRFGAEESWFFTRGELGLRLVYARAITDGAQHRLGTVAAERALTTSDGVRPSPAAMFRYPTSAAPAAIYPVETTAPVGPGDIAFAVDAPEGERLLTAVIGSADLDYTHLRWRRAGQSLAWTVLAITALLTIRPVHAWGRLARSCGRRAAATAGIAGAVLAARLLWWWASPADWVSHGLFSSSSYASAWVRPFLASPLDFLLTMVTMAALVALASPLFEAARLASRRGRRRDVDTTPALLGYMLTQLSAGALCAAMLVVYQRFLADTLANTTLDLLHFSLHPWSGERVAIQTGIVLSNATLVAFSVMVLRSPRFIWRVRLRRVRILAVTVVAWLAPLALWQIVQLAGAVDLRPLMVVTLVAAVLASLARRLRLAYRHGSQAFRLVTAAVLLVVPSLAVYPALFQLAWRAKTDLIATRFATQTINQREAIKSLLQQSLAQIDAYPLLDGLVTLTPGPDVRPDTDRAFDVWRTTSLATPVSSSIEIYGGHRALVSRFAFNLPEDLSTMGSRDEATCSWDVFEEVSPFFAEERRVLHAGRAVCDSAGAHIGSIVVHAMLDYGDLPFIASQSPYVALLRRDERRRDEDLTGRDVEYAVYGWSRQPLYASRATAWSLPDAVFERATSSRDPFWTELARGDSRFAAYVLTDRGGIHALGAPIVAPIGHLVNLAELIALCGLVYLAFVVGSALLGALSGDPAADGRALFREVRASFYRKLFLAFVAAAVVPVVALAVVTRAYVAGQILQSIESEAVRVAAAARRIVEDLAAPRATLRATGVDDDLMVWVSRLLGEDVNVFVGPRLAATSERSLFASGLLPTRTPADVYRDLTVRMQASTVSRDRLGELEYMVVGAPITVGGAPALLTVPLMLRQQDVESEIDTLDRRVLLAVVVFILAGAGIGYYMAERIADPVNRLTRATRRIARGDFEAQVVSTASDELSRLVRDFNDMAHQLRRQRAELERTHRLEAWAEMARQVAHDIKNPLTPIQLNAEHLKRVHVDRGEPLGPVVQECVENILQQVRLLRQIASEFSAFASAPIARPSTVDLRELLTSIVEPYRVGLAGRITVTLDLPGDLPPVLVDKNLTARALTNVVENALHAMPGEGTLAVRAWVASSGDDQARAVHVRVTDTGSGMDAEALARAFEPYFSTKVTGTGLGLPIAKRNVELSGGTIAMASEPSRGTVVELTFPAISSLAPPRARPLATTAQR